MQPTSQSKKLKQIKQLAKHGHSCCSPLLNNQQLFEVPPTVCIWLTDIVHSTLFFNPVRPPNYDHLNSTNIIVYISLFTPNVCNQVGYPPRALLDSNQEYFKSWTAMRDECFLSPLPAQTLIQILHSSSVHSVPGFTFAEPCQGSCLHVFVCVGAGDWARALCMLGKYCQNQATTSVSHVSIYWGLPSIATYMWLAICLPHKLLSHLLFSFYLMPPNCIFYCTVCL